MPTIAVCDSVEEIDFDALPDKFVLKCTHDSEGLTICTDKSKLNREEAKRKLREAQKYNFFYIGREWPYKNVKPRIIAEPYLEDKQSGQLKDYKFLCFDGEPFIMYVASDRNIGETKFDYFDMDFNRLPITQHYGHVDGDVEKPQNFELMKELAAKLAEGFPHVRVDFYECNGNVYVGELTFFHFSGFTPFVPDEWDFILGDKLKLPHKIVS